MSGILNRTIYFERLSNGALRQMEFALVNTSLGAMVEPVPVPGLGGSLPAVTTDNLDGAADHIEIVERAEILSTQFTSGLQSPRTF